jgi:hypothetical protein
MKSEQLITTMETLGKLKCRIAVIDDLQRTEVEGFDIWS